MFEQDVSNLSTVQHKSAPIKSPIHKISNKNPLRYVADKLLRNIIHGRKTEQEKEQTTNNVRHSGNSRCSLNALRKSIDETVRTIASIKLYASA